MRAASPQGGFSLLEVLVAFVIVSLVATAIFRLFSGALGNASAAEEYSRAALFAQSVQAETAANALHERTLAGDAEEGRLHWKVQVTPYEAPGVSADLQRASEALPTRMYRIVTTVTFTGGNGKERDIVLTTIRVGPRETLP